MADSNAERAMRAVCRDLSKFKSVFMFGVVLVGLSLLWLPFVDPNSATYVIVVMNLVGGAGFSGISGFFIRHCRKRDRERREAYRAEPK